VRGPVIDFHCHLLAARHGKVWFEAAAHHGIDLATIHIEAGDAEAKVGDNWNEMEKYKAA